MEDATNGLILHAFTASVTLNAMDSTKRSSVLSHPSAEVQRRRIFTDAQTHLAVSQAISGFQRVEMGVHKGWEVADGAGNGHR